MTGEETAALHRGLGQLEGRIASVERASAEHTAALAAARAEHNADLGRIYDKLDTISAKINQGMGMAAAGRVIWSAVMAAIGAAAAYFWPAK